MKKNLISLLFVLSCVVGGSALANIDNGLVGHYPFNGNANDESGNGNNGSLLNGVILTEDRFGNTDSAYHFDGTNDYIWFGNSFPKTDYVTASVWINTTSTGHDTQINYGGGGRILRYRGGGYWMTLSDNGPVSGAMHINTQAHYSPADTNAYNDGNWHHLVISFDGSVFKLYIDGQLLHEDDNFGNNETINYLGGGGFAIGRDGDYNASYFEGTIDDVRIYDRALSENEVLTLYNAPDPNLPPYTVVETQLIPDQNDNGADEVAVLKINNANNKSFVTVKDGLTGSTLQNILFTSALFTAKSFKLQPDLNGNGAPEISVTAIRNSDNRVLQITRDYASKDRINFTE